MSEPVIVVGAEQKIAAVVGTQTQPKTKTKAKAVRKPRVKKPKDETKVEKKPRKPRSKLASVTGGAKVAATVSNREEPPLPEPRWIDIPIDNIIPRYPWPKNHPLLRLTDTSLAIADAPVPMEVEQKVAVQAPVPVPVQQGAEQKGIVLAPPVVPLAEPFDMDMDETDDDVKSIMAASAEKYANEIKHIEALQLGVTQRVIAHALEQSRGSMDEAVMLIMSKVVVPAVPAVVAPAAAQAQAPPVAAAPVQRSSDESKGSKSKKRQRKIVFGDGDHRELQAKGRVVVPTSVLSITEACRGRDLPLTDRFAFVNVQRLPHTEPINGRTMVDPAFFSCVVGDRGPHLKDTVLETKVNTYSVVLYDEKHSSSTQGRYHVLQLIKRHDDSGDLPYGIWSRSVEVRIKDAEEDRPFLAAGDKVKVNDLPVDRYAAHSSARSYKPCATRTDALKTFKLKFRNYTLREYDTVMHEVKMGNFDPNYTPGRYVRGVFVNDTAVWLKLFQLGDLFANRRIAPKWKCQLDVAGLEHYLKWKSKDVPLALFDIAEMYRTPTSLIHTPNVVGPTATTTDLCNWIIGREVGSRGEGHSIYDHSLIKLPASDSFLFDIDNKIIYPKSTYESAFKEPNGPSLHIPGGVVCLSPNWTRSGSLATSMFLLDMLNRDHGNVNAPMKRVLRAVDCQEPYSMSGPRTRAFECHATLVITSDAMQVSPFDSSLFPADIFQSRNGAHFEILPIYNAVQWTSLTYGDILRSDLIIMSLSTLQDINVQRFLAEFAGKAKDRLFSQAIDYRYAQTPKQPLPPDVMMDTLKMQDLERRLSSNGVKSIVDINNPSITHFSFKRVIFHGKGTAAKSTIRRVKGKDSRVVHMDYSFSRLVDIRSPSRWYLTEAQTCMEGGLKEVRAALHFLHPRLTSEGDTSKPLFPDKRYPDVLETKSLYPIVKILHDQYMIQV